MKRALLPSLALAATVLLAACGSQKGETVFTAGPNSADTNGKAPSSGTYLLYTSMSPNPTNTVTLKEGDPMGFRKSADGRIEAFWNDQKYDFEKNTAQVYWKLEK